MAWYTYGTVAVFDPVTDTVQENAAGGQFVLVKDGPPLPIRDLNGNPIAEITSNGSGQSSQFMVEDRLTGLIQFGDLVVTVWANEAGELALSASGAAQSAADAQTAAQAALTQAQAAAAQAAAAAQTAAQATGGNTHTIYGATTPRLNPMTGAAIPPGAVVLWVADVQPTNMASNDIWFIGPAS